MRPFVPNLSEAFREIGARAEAGAGIEEQPQPWNAKVHSYSFVSQFVSFNNSNYRTNEGQRSAIKPNSVPIYPWNRVTCEPRFVPPLDQYTAMNMQFQEQCLLLQRFGELVLQHQLSSNGPTNYPQAPRVYPTYQTAPTSAPFAYQRPAPIVKAENIEEMAATAKNSQQSHSKVGSVNGASSASTDAFKNLLIKRNKIFDMQRARHENVRNSVADLSTADGHDAVDEKESALNRRPVKRTYSPVTIPPELEISKDFHPVGVSEINSPDKFWIRLNAGKDDFVNFMRAFK